MLAGPDDVAFRLLFSGYIKWKTALDDGLYPALPDPRSVLPFKTSRALPRSSSLVQP